MTHSYDFRISDLLLRVESPRQLQIPDSFQPFLIETDLDKTPDILLEIHFETLHANAVADADPPAFAGAQSSAASVEKYHWRDGEYIVRQNEAGRGTPCRLFLPDSFSDIFCQNGHWLNYIGIEQLFLPFERLILHASAVIYHGKAYLFSAPSGTGKSTHAALWNAHYGAKILNGDKVVIHVGSEGAMAYGSPVAGSSQIYCNDGAPIAGIFVLKQGPQNILSTIPSRRAILSLYGQAIKSSKDPAFNSRLFDLIVKLRGRVPVFSLECLPEKSAVDCILHKIEGMTP